MKIQLTKHALERIKERKITRKEIIETLSKPDKKEIKDETKIAMKLRGNGHLLIVIYIKIKSIFKIITVIDTSKIEKYL